MNIANIFGFTEDSQSVDSQDVMNQNQIMQETALDLDNQNTTEPAPSSYRGGTQKRPVGGTRETEDKREELYNINTKFIVGLGDGINNNNMDYAKNTIASLGRDIVLDGKTYTIDQLSDLMKDEKNKEKVLKLVDDLQNDPELPTDVRWDNIKNRVNNMLLYGEVDFFIKKLDQEMYSAAKTHDAYYGDNSTQSNQKLYWPNRNTKFLFDEKGNMRTKEEFLEYANQERKKELEQVEKEMVIPDLNTVNSRFTFEQPGQRSDMGSWLPNLNVRGDQGRMQSVSTVRNPLGMSEYDLMVFNKKNKIDQINNVYGNLSYDELKNSTKTFYNKQDSKSTKFKAIAEKKYTKDNKGGELQTQTGEFEFDFVSPKYYDKSQKKQLIKPAVNEFFRITNIVNTDPGKILYNAGEVTANPTQNEGEKEDIRMLFKYMSEDAVNKKKAPKGSIIFQPNIKGEDGMLYDAYTFKLNNNYIDQEKFKGEKKGDGDSKEYNGLGWKNGRVYAKKGFTVYIPSKVSQRNVETARRYKEASTTSSVEALLNTTGTVSMDIPNAGALTISKDDNTGAVTFGGYTVDYNPSNGKYDTTRITPNQVIVGSPDVDIDYIFSNDYLNGLFKTKYSINDYLKQETLKIKGVKDPNQLTGQ